jgi:hypothetical protein
MSASQPTRQRLHGTVFGELDPTDHLNAGIVNLNRAARNARGQRWPAPASVF